MVLSVHATIPHDGLPKRLAGRRVHAQHDVVGEGECLFFRVRWKFLAGITGILGLLQQPLTGQLWSGPDETRCWWLGRQNVFRNRKILAARRAGVSKPKLL